MRTMTHQATDRAVVGGIDPAELKGHFAKDGESGFIHIVCVVKKHSDGAAKRGDLRLQVDHSIGDFVVHPEFNKAKADVGPVNPAPVFPRAFRCLKVHVERPAPSSRRAFVVAAAAATF